MQKKHAMIITTLSVASIVLGFLVFARAGSQFWFRLDLTKAKAYTISEVSRKLYEEIDDNVRLTYYVSEKLKTVSPIPGEIEDILREYANYSHGKIIFRAIDPQKAGVEDVVTRLGIPGQQIQTVEKDQATVSIVYTGILIEYLDKSSVIPVVFSLDTLEYDLTTRIRSLIRGVTREAGLLAADTGPDGQPLQYQALTQTMKNAGYTVTPLTPADEIPARLLCLIVVGGAESLDETAQKNIDLFVRRGGKLLVCADSFVISAAQSVQARQAEDKGFFAQLAKYGVEIEKALALDVSCKTTTIQSTAQNGTRVLRLVQYPFWIEALAQYGNTAHPITARFEGADLFWPSPLKVTPPSGVEAATLFSSTPEAWLETKNFYVSPDQEFLFQMEKEATTGQKVFAAALSGTFPAAFPETEEAAATPGAARIIVVGDSDFAGDAWAGNSQLNMNFLVQSADYLSNDDDIISIRNRQGATGRLNKITDPEKRAAAMAFARTLNVVIIPVLVLIVMIAALQTRSRALKKKEEEDNAQ